MAARPGSARPTAPPGPANADGLPVQAAWVVWGQMASGLGHGLGLGVDLQQQCARRWALRQQELALHWPVPGDPGSWMNAGLAGMRWSLQEWQQVFQDLMAAPLQWRGELGREPVAPLVLAGQQLVQQQAQAWADFWTATTRHRER